MHWHIERHNHDPTVCCVPTMHVAKCCLKPRQHVCLNSTSSWLGVLKQCIAANSAMMRTSVLLTCECFPCSLIWPNATINLLCSVSQPPQPVITSIKPQRQDSVLHVANDHSLMSRFKATGVRQTLSTGLNGGERVADRIQEY